MLALITFKVSFNTGDNVIEHWKFTVKLNDLTTKKLTSCIFVPKNLEKENAPFRPILYVDENGNRVFVNSSETDFEEFVNYLRQHGHRDHKEILLDVPDTGDLLHKMIVGQQTVRSWREHRKELELNVAEITHLFNQQISDDSIQKIREKQSYSFINVFNGWSPPSPKEAPLDTNFSESGLLNVKRVSRNEAMRLVRSGMGMLVPSEDDSHLLMTFSKFSGSGHNFFSWQEQNDGNYKCQEVKVPVTVGRQAMTYYSLDGKTLIENFDELLKSTADTRAEETVASCSDQMTNTQVEHRSEVISHLNLAPAPRQEGSTSTSSDVVPEDSNDVREKNAAASAAAYVAGRVADRKYPFDKQTIDEVIFPETEKSFELRGNTLYYDLLRHKLEMLPNTSRFDCAFFFKKSVLIDADFSQMTLVPKSIPWELNCLIQSMDVKSTSSMYCIEFKSKDKCGSFDCWFSLKENSTDAYFEFKIEVVVDQQNSRYDYVYESLIESNFLIRYHENGALTDTREPNAVEILTEHRGVDPLPEKETADEQVCKGRSNVSVDGDSDSSISISFEELDVQDKLSDSYEIVNIPPCFATNGGDGQQHDSIKVRVKRRRVSGERGNVKPKSVPELTPTASSSYAEPKPVEKEFASTQTTTEPDPLNPRFMFPEEYTYNDSYDPMYTVTCPSSTESEKPAVNILPDKVFEMTSNVFKSVLNSVKQQSDEIQKTVEESLAAASQFIPGTLSNAGAAAAGATATGVSFGGEAAGATATGVSFGAEAAGVSYGVEASGQSPNPSYGRKMKKNRTRSSDKNAKEASAACPFYLRDGLSAEMKIQLQNLNEMGFLNDHHNIFLLTQYPNDMEKVIESLLNFSEAR